MKQLADITEYYSNKTDEIPHNQYKRKFEVEEMSVGVCEFELCNLPIFESNGIYTDGKKVFCCKWHMDEQKLWEEENE